VNVQAKDESSDGQSGQSGVACAMRRLLVLCPMGCAPPAGSAQKTPRSIGDSRQNGYAFSGKLLIDESKSHRGTLTYYISVGVFSHILNCTFRDSVNVRPRG
jgi:hypothetical protein